MKKENNYWHLTLSFLLGCLICFFCSQFKYFKIDTQINVIGTLLSIITALIGFYIAISIQKKHTKTQNQYSFIQAKLDSLWSEFNVFSQIFNYDDKIEIGALTKFTKDAYLSISFLKNIYASFDLKIGKLSLLEKNIEKFEEFICSLPISENIYSTTDNETIISSHILSISKSFSDILKEIHNY